MGDEKRVSVTYPSLPNEVKSGDTILLQMERSNFRS